VTVRMPVVFFGHGNPLNALEDNVYTRAWARLGAEIVRPRAVLAISAHWYVAACRVTAMSAPPTIHDFGGFPPALYAIEYPAAGDPELAARVQALLAPVPVARDMDWGLDHGTWSVLRHVFPEASVPVVQLSIDATQPPAYHYAQGRKLQALREEGVLVIGSGNVVHNLRAYAWDRSAVAPYDWALRFEQHVRQSLAARAHTELIDYAALGHDAAQAVPTPDHYLPLLYVLGAADESDELTFPVQGFEGGSISMLGAMFAA
jgi:4,5-DOPA dioxygenase extradiol